MNINNMNSTPNPNDNYYTVPPTVYPSPTFYQYDPNTYKPYKHNKSSFGVYDVFWYFMITLIHLLPSYLTNNKNFVWVLIPMVLLLYIGFLLLLLSIPLYIVWIFLIPILKRAMALD
jgi:hypothetical protein